MAWSLTPLTGLYILAEMLYKQMKAFAKNPQFPTPKKSVEPEKKNNNRERENI